MRQTLLLAGIGTVIAALVGGGVKLASIEVPTFGSVRRQVLLGVFGLFILLLGLRSNEDPQPPPPPAKTGSTAPAATGATPNAPASAAPPNDSCVGFAPCGGDLTGSWELTRLCPLGKLALFGAACPAASVSFTDLRARGRAVFSGGRNFESDTTTGFDADVTLPLDCQPGVSCADYGRVVAAAFPTGSCAPAGAQCKCHIRTADASAFDRGTYATSGERLTTRSETRDDAPPGDYCVSGGVFRLKMDNAILSTVLVFKRAR